MKVALGDLAFPNASVGVLAGLDVGDGGLVVGELVVKPPVGDLDAERPAGASLDLLDLALDIVRALLVVGKGEHDRRLGPGAAGLVHPGAFDASRALQGT